MSSKGFKTNVRICNRRHVLKGLVFLGVIYTCKLIFTNIRANKLRSNLLENVRLLQADTLIPNLNVPEMLEPFNHMMDEANALSHQLFDGALPDALDYTGEVGYVKRVDGQRIVSSERQGKANDLKQTINISDIDTEQEDTDPQHRDVEDNGGQRSQVAESEMGTDRGKGSNADNQNTGEIEGAPKESEDVRGDGEEGVSKSAQESSESKEMSSESKETSSESKEMSSESKETSSESKEMSNESKEMSNESKGAPNESKETSSESKGAPSESKETSSESRETSSESKEMSSESKETSSESKETSSESKDMPSKGESASSKSKGASDDTVSDYGSNNDNNGAEAEAALKGQHDKLHENERESHDEDLGTTNSVDMPVDDEDIEDDAKYSDSNRMRKKKFRDAHRCENLVGKVVTDHKDYMKSFAITTVVDASKYIYYAPLYILYILEAYPEYYVAVYVQGRIKNEVWNLMRDVPYDRWCLQEHHEETTALSKAPAVSRFLLVDEFLQQFKYAYFGDVDIAWIKDEEKRPPLQSHKSHARRMGVPYSNVQRTIRQAICDKPKQWWKNQNIACNRMTGLHFIEVEPWYNKTRPLIMDYRTKIEEKGVETFCKEDLHLADPFYCDEVLLYDLIDRGINQLPTYYHRPKHGVHLHMYADKWYVSRTLEEIAEANTFINVANKHPVFMENFMYVAQEQMAGTLVHKFLMVEGPHRKTFVKKFLKYLSDNKMHMPPQYQGLIVDGKPKEPESVIYKQIGATRLMQMKKESEERVADLKQELKRKLAS